MQKCHGGMGFPLWNSRCSIICSCSGWVKMIPMLAGLRSVKSIRHVIECWDMFTSRWIQGFVQGDYLHLDLFFTAKELRGTGIGSAMLKALLVHAQEIGKDVTMETHHAENLSLYYKAGFVLMVKSHRSRHPSV